MPTGAGLRALAQLEVQRLDPVEDRLVPPEAARRQLVQVAGALRLLLGQHPTLARADRRARALGPPASAVLASAEIAPKLMSETKTGIRRCSGLAAAGPIVTAVSTGWSSSIGKRCSWAVSTWMSSQLGSSARGTPIAATSPCMPDRPLRQPVDLGDERLLAVSWWGRRTAGRRWR